MLCRISKKSNLFRRTRIVFSLAALLASHSAWADLTVVSTVNVSGLTTDTNATKQPSFPITTTTYFQGEFSRMDTTGQSSYIFDNDKGIVYQLDVSSHTYRTALLKDVERYNPTQLGSGKDHYSVDSDLSTGESIDTAKYLGVVTTDVPVAGYAHISRVQTQTDTGRSGTGGHRRSGGGGGFPNLHFGDSDAGASSQPTSHRMKPPSYDIIGDLWVSPNTLLPKSKHFDDFPIAIQLIWSGSPFIGDLNKSLGDIRKLPLHSVVTITQTFASSNGDDTSLAQKNVIVTTFDVNSIDTNPIAGDLFSIPSDYAKDNNEVTFPQLAPPINPEQLSAITGN